MLLYSFIGSFISFGGMYDLFDFNLVWQGVALCDFFHASHNWRDELNLGEVV
jgi:hypothetical protein